MKTCPDCAESVQDAARKCRFCGYRFDAEPAGGDPRAEEQDADEGGSAAATVPSVGREQAAGSTGSGVASAGFLLVAIGAAAVSIGGLAGALAAGVGVEHVGKVVALASVGGLVLGGLLLAIGWGITSSRGQAGVGGLFGGLALVAGQAIALAIGGGEANVLQGLAASAGMVVCLVLHLGTLEEAHFDGTRTAALVALFGVGGELFSFAKQWQLPQWIWTTLAWCGLGGVVLFGLSLAAAATLRLRGR